MCQHGGDGDATKCIIIMLASQTSDETYSHVRRKGLLQTHDATECI